jgi:predicted nucleic acid-binding Zn ribbon protein
VALVSRLAPRPLSLALEGLTAELAPVSVLARVQKEWEPAVGPAVAAAATPAAERDGLLTITCSAAVWAQELDLMAGELLARLNTALGEELLHKLRCRVI